MLINVAWKYLFSHCHPSSHELSGCAGDDLDKSAAHSPLLFTSMIFPKHCFLFITLLPPIPQRAAEPRQVWKRDRDALKWIWCCTFCCVLKGVASERGWWWGNEKVVLTRLKRERKYNPGKRHWKAQSFNMQCIWDLGLRHGSRKENDVLDQMEDNRSWWLPKTRLLWFGPREISVISSTKSIRGMPFCLLIHCVCNN